MKKLKWLVIKSNKQGYGPCPEEQVIRPARAFKELIEKETNGEISVEILTTATYEQQYGKRLFGIRDVMKALQSNEIQMSQVEVYELGHMDKNFYVFDMPWMFKSHAHASRVLEGQIGKAMNKRLMAHDIKGLGYTYSGGYRSIGGFKSIPTLEDLASKNLLINGNPVTKDYMDVLGITTTRSKNDEDIDARDTTYIRFKEATNFLKTNHSLFLTDVLTNATFWNSLTESQQAAFEKVTEQVARLERGWTTADAETFEKTAKERGCQIVELSDADKKTMQDKAETVYKMWEDQYTPGLVNKIQKLQ